MNLGPYASHLPVLAALSWLLPMRCVLEFGAGLHSTPLFLSLPQVEKLVSVETDAKWLALIAKCKDERLEVRKTRPPSLSCFDLIFVDDGEVAAERVRTIRWVLGQPHPPVVVHDAEVAEYREAIRDTEHYIFRDETPWTALVL